MLCEDAGDSEPLAHDKWRSLLPYIVRHSLHPWNEVESPWQRHALRDLVLAPCLNVTLPEAHSLKFSFGNGALESTSEMSSLRYIPDEDLLIIGKLARGLLAWNNISVVWAKTRGTERPSLTVLPTPLNYRSSPRTSLGKSSGSKI